MTKICCYCLGTTTTAVDVDDDDDDIVPTYD